MSVKDKEITKKPEDDQFEEITLFKNPIQTLTILVQILVGELRNLLKFLIKNYYIPVIIIIYLLLNFSIEGPHREYTGLFNKILSFCTYWIILGVLSSIGLGTGLHTFVLYLGPHIAKVTLAANECSYFPVMFPNRWEFTEFQPCERPSTPTQVTSFWEILLNTYFEAFLWGFGTALGELPPYFMARAARLSGKSLDEIEELEKIKTHYNEMGFIDKAKYFICTRLKSHGFIIVTLMASVPNPLFDLAGITCGHFLVPFSTFFGATFIGKSLVKVTLQSVFVIITFSQHHVEHILNFLEGNFPILKNSLSKTLEKQKKMLWHTDQKVDLDSGKPLIATLWEIIISLMIIYFLVSIVNSVVNNRRRELKEIEGKKEK